MEKGNQEKKKNVRMRRSETERKDPSGLGRMALMWAATSLSDAAMVATGSSSSSRISFWLIKSVLSNVISSYLVLH